MDSLGQIERVLVLGGGSDLAQAVLVRLARRGLRSAVLAAREPDAAIEALRARGALGDVELVPLRWDATEVADHDDVFDTLFESGPDFDLVLCAVGVLGHHQGAETPAAAAAASLAANFTGPAAALLAVGRALARQGSGHIVVLSSVAGIRPRKSNFVYGSAKAGLDAFAQGLADSLVTSGVTVSIVRPGFVDTKMTAGLPRAPLAVSADRVADDICKHALPPTARRIVWSPAILQPIFTVFRMLPAPLWRKIAADR